MRWIVLAVLVVLAGCAGRVADQEPRVVRIEVPVPVPCRVDLVPRPAWVVDALPLGAPIDEQMRALRAERYQRIGYEAQLMTANRACQN